MDLRKFCIFASFSLLPMYAALADDRPVYVAESQQLHIPVTDIPSQQGAYHDAVFEFVQGDLWRLTQLSQGVEISGIQKVSVIKTDSFPVQVLLEVSGWWGGCGGLHIGQRQTDAGFEISIQSVYTPGPPVIVCAAVVSFFSWIVPLPVYGLKAGEYHYRVNDSVAYAQDVPVSTKPGEVTVKQEGSLAGSFVLDRDNMLERAAPEYPAFISPPVITVIKTGSLSE